MLTLKLTAMINPKTCYKTQSEHNVRCQRQGCKHWFKCAECNNCTIIGALDGQHSLQEIGDMLGTTRMQICRVERDVLQKFRESAERMIEQSDTIPTS
jgi:hypothetical protein